MKSESAEIHFKTGNELKDAGKFDEAIDSYQKALEIEPDSAEALNQLGEVYFLRGRLAEALAACQQALKIQPDFAEGYKTLGNVLQGQGKIDAAIRAYSKAVEIKPEFAQAHSNLGSMFYRQGQLESAVACYERARELKPDLAAVHSNLGKVLQQLGRLDEAVACWRKALELNPGAGSADFYLNMGSAFLLQGRLEEAFGSFQRAIALKPDLAEAHINTGSILLQQGKPEEAIASCQKALELKPNLAEAHSNMGLALQQQGKIEAAIGSFQKAIEWKPDLIEAHENLCGLLNTLWKTNNSELRQAADRFVLGAGEKGQLKAATFFINAYLESGLSKVAAEKFLQTEALIHEKAGSLSGKDAVALYSIFLFLAPHLRDDLEENAKLARLVGGKIVQELEGRAGLKNSGEAWERVRKSSEGSQLRIGFISRHFKKHSVGWCCADIIRELSAITPHIFLYVTGKLVADERTKLFEGVAEKFYWPKKYPLNGELADAGEVREQILQDELDVLVDLDSVTVPVHAEILYGQPAPVCVSWLGWEPPFVSGSNYFVCDWHTLPAGTEQHYTEQLVRMPDSFMAVSGFESAPLEGESTRRALRISSDQVVYMSVSPGRKLNPDLVRAQVEILKHVPSSLLLHRGRADLEVVQSMYKEECARQGVGLHRLKFMGFVEPPEKHRSRYLLGDVLLDSYPCNGGTLTLEALWFNLPVVTRRGEQFYSRVAYSFLKSLGIEAGVAGSWEEYVEWGVKFGKDADLRHAVREQLVKSKQPENLAPVWNPQKFARDMYGVFQELLARKVSAAG
ncbi:MAG: tetratricopeptide repeat protein [Oscillatoria princeps RMCB-10]|nr:tetratricopeptide repeat protein [Oscillatoria princeps RMCB-10]